MIVKWQSDTPKMVKWQSDAPKMELKVPSEIKIDGYIPTAEDLTFTTNTSYSFSNDRFSWLFNHYDGIKIKSGGNSSYMFASSHSITDLSNVSVTFPFSASNVKGMYYDCQKLKYFPRMSGNVESVGRMFYNCLAVEEFPDDFFDNLKLEDNYYAESGGSMFMDCHNLKKMPQLKTFFDAAGSPPRYPEYNVLSRLFTNCYSLKQITNVPIPQSYQTTNVQQNMLEFSFSGTHNLTSLTFAPIQKPLPWAGQILDLTSNVGFKKVNYSDKTSQLDSVYNYDSAVETINSLPDTSVYLAEAGGTNTIQFYSNQGANTEGGAIGNLTAEKIAVAAAKGWTVALR